MEREFKPPTGSPETAAPKPVPAPERAPKTDKKETAPDKPSKKSEKSESKQTEFAEKPVRKLGGRVLNLLFGRPNTEVPEPQPTEAPVETAEAQTDTSEVAPVIEQAGRVRRFARLVINRVMGEAAAEPERAQAEASLEPLDTVPLVAAADDLREAADDLDDTLREAKETVVYERRHVESSMSSPDFEGLRVFEDYRASERITQQVERLEAKADTAATASLVAAGLGVVAVLMAGHEYFARKRVEKTQVKFGKAQEALEKQVKAQRQEFVALQKEQAAQMDREHRKDYYERLSEFTHKQAASTREVNTELQHTLESALPAPEPLPAVEALPVKAPTPERPQIPALPEPLRKVENADTIERGGQAGNAGTGFFGGGMTGLGDRVQQALGISKPVSTSQPTKEQIAAEAKRKAQLASNAWIYSIGFVIAVIALILSLVFSG